MGFIIQVRDANNLDNQVGIIKHWCGSEPFHIILGSQLKFISESVTQENILLGNLCGFWRISFNSYKPGFTYDGYLV